MLLADFGADVIIVNKPQPNIISPFAFNKNNLVKIIDFAFIFKYNLFLLISEQRKTFNNIRFKAITTY